MSYCASRSCQHKAPEVASDARQLFGKIKPPEELSVTRSHLGGFDKTALKKNPDVTTWPTSALSNVNILIFFITILVTLKPTVLLLNTYVLQKHEDWKKPWKKKKREENLELWRCSVRSQVLWVRHTYLTSPPFSLTLSTSLTYRFRVRRSFDLEFRSQT